MPSDNECPPLDSVAVYFDLSASSYLAVVRVLDLAQRTGATLSFRPVSTALFNKLTDAPPPPVFKGNKAARLKDDFDRYAARWNLVLKESVPPCDRALRVLHAAPDDASRGKLAIAMLQALHLGTADLEDIETLKRMSFGIVSAPEDVANAVQEDSVAAGNLQRTTEEYATHMGGLSLPGFWVPNPDLPTGQHGVGFADGGEIHMGHDRLHFVETRLKCNANPSSLPVPMPRIAAGPLKRHQTLNFWFDFSSPWTYLGYTQLRRLAAEAGDYLTINLKPTLLGIVFKEIGTPVVPTAVATKARQAWQQVELQRWASYWSEKPFKGSEPVPFKWSEHFPLRTPLALRMVCAAIAQKWSAEEVMKLSDTICGFSMATLQRV